MPTVYRETTYEKNEIAKRDKIFIKKKDEENLGIKHLLGHTFNLPYSDSGLAISKSTYKLNKLQDVRLKTKQNKTKQNKTKIINKLN